ncbi:uncharacterized protein LOC113234396 [Hyposmocoma kahamanoa]|uniref:uncharacterized protein LOC113234396 n=1 Tax=Hyposmocoma kahamanoa TaxID=1477025 RepID=UPI000E6D8B24|nr:uncharacterized protein LOC113234396 [Hyposmocoma kahamanoa]
MLSSDPQWFRAVLVEQVSGAGGQQLSLLYVDFGNIDTIDVSQVRKMLPDFVSGVPALVNSLEIRNFPNNPSEDQLRNALEHLQLTEDGRGTLRFTRCVKEHDGLYTVDAPALITAMNST